MAADPTIRSEDLVLEDVTKLKPHPRNPRQGDVGAISESIRVNGYMAPVIAQRSTGFVIDGNHRLAAAKALGMREVPTVWVDVDDDTALRYLLAANRTNDLAAYDDQHLAELLLGLTETPPGLEGTAFDGEDLDALIADLNRAADTTLGEINPPAAPKQQGDHPARCPRCGWPDEAGE